MLAARCPHPEWSVPSQVLPSMTETVSLLVTTEVWLGSRTPKVGRVDGTGFLAHRQAVGPGTDGDHTRALATAGYHQGVTSSRVYYRHLACACAEGHVEGLRRLVYDRHAG
jgi:hypothetical protein